MKKAGLILIVLLVTVLFSKIMAQSEFSSNLIGVGVVVTDLEKSIDFYTNVIGMKVVEEFDIDEAFSKVSGLAGGAPFSVKVLKLEESNVVDRPTIKRYSPFFVKVSALHFPKLPLLFAVLKTVRWRTVRSHFKMRRLDSTINTVGRRSYPLLGNEHGTAATEVKPSIYLRVGLSKPGVPASGCGLPIDYVVLGQ